MRGFASPDATDDLGDGRTLAGIDIDDCRDTQTGELSAEAQQTVARTGIYFEASPTGTGIKGLCIGEKPPGACANGDYEVYDRGRFFIVTGHVLPGSPKELQEATEALAWFHSTFIQSAPSMNERNRAVKALKSLSPNRADDYHQWVSVGMSLRSVGDDMFVEWDQWSKQSSKYKPGECAEKWSSFDGTGVGIGSLLMWATEDGPAVATPKVNFNFLTSAQLATGDFSLEYLIDGLMVGGQPLIIAGASVEAGVEEVGRVLERGALGEGQLHLVLVRLAGADHSGVRPDENPRWIRGLPPFHFLDHFGIGLVDELSDPGERLAPPIIQVLYSRIDQVRGRIFCFSFVRIALRLFHGCSRRVRFPTSADSRFFLGRTA